MRKTLIIIVLALFACKAEAQIIPDYEKDGSDLNVLYRNEQTYGFYMHTRGYGAFYRRSKHITGKSKAFYEINFNTLKHPKEVKLTGTDVERKRYIYGKLNNVAFLYAGVGKQKTITSKADKKAIEVRYAYSLGPGVAFAKPYYYSTITKDASSFNKFRRFNEETFTQDSVIGRAPFSNGLTEMSFYPYAGGKFSLSFEYAPYSNLVKALEVGVSAQFFPIGLRTMARNPSERFIVNLYAAFVFGSRWY